VLAGLKGMAIASTEMNPRKCNNSIAQSKQTMMEKHQHAVKMQGLNCKYRRPAAPRAGGGVLGLGEAVSQPPFPTS